jgi:protein involved in polysaccharide export with SLBB domain
VFQNFTLSLSMGRIRSLEVFVVGQARKPGKHVVSGLSTLVNALFETGGPSANGSLRQVQLRRGGKTIANVDLYQFLAKGDLSADVRLQSGDVIVIPPAGGRAALLGTLNAPAIYELKSGDSIASVLDLSGGLPALATPKKAQLERLNAQRDIPRYVEDFSLDAAGLQRPLQDGDVLTVFQISPQIDSVVTLQGHVAAPMRYNFKPGMKVSDLLADPRLLITSNYWQQLNAGNNPGQLPVVNFDYATIRRLNPATLRTELLTFNLGQAIAKSPAADLTLQSGDIVTVYSSADIALPVEKRLQQVTLEGEVNIPGTYQLLPGETLPQLIRRAGGLTPNAYLYSAAFTRESTRRQQQDNLDRALRRAESDLANQTSTLLQNQNAKDQTAIQAQIELQKQQLARLRSLKASGRLALEVSPQARQLPALKLENGDRISIPSSPDFVDVQGEVLAENAFMHRAGDTVASYLERAGVTRDADLDNLMLIRANGSVESAALQGGLFGWASDIKNRTVYPGDTVFVPTKVDRRTGYTRFVEGAKDWTAMLYQLGLGAAAIKVLKN